MSSSREILELESFFFDLDGVLWECEKLLPGVPELLNFLQEEGKGIYYVTNNATRDRKSFYDLFCRLGLPVQESNIICAAYSSARYLSGKYEPGSLIYVIGCEGLVNEIKAAGFEVISSVDMENFKQGTNDLGNLEVTPGIKAVVVGYTIKLNFYMLSYGLNCLALGAELITGNYDKCDKLGKYNAPGAACTIEFLRYSLKNNFTNVGKPERCVIDGIIDRDRLNRDKCVMFGDKMNTDIKLGLNSGIKTVLMLTGVETEHTYINYDFKPDYVLANLDEILNS